LSTENASKRLPQQISPTKKYKLFFFSFSLNIIFGDYFWRFIKVFF